MSYYINYTYDPNEPGSKEKAQKEAYSNFLLSPVFFLTTVGAYGYFLYNVYLLVYKSIVSYAFIGAILFLLLSAIIVFHILHRKSNKKTKQDNIKVYMFIFVEVTIFLTGLILLLSGVLLSAQNKPGSVSLFIGVISILGSLIIAFLFYIKIKRIPLYVNKKEIFNISEFQEETFKSKYDYNRLRCNSNESADEQTNRYSISDSTLYCHFCGEKLLNNSVICYNCGTIL